MGRARGCLADVTDWRCGLVALRGQLTGATGRRKDDGPGSLQTEALRWPGASGSCANRDGRMESSSMKLMSWASKRLVVPPLAMSGVRFGRGLCPV